MQVTFSETPLLIYKITCLVNNKIYIGCTTKTLGERWDVHVMAHTQARTALHRAMKKYGLLQFRMEVITTANSIEEMFELEKKYILDLNSHTTKGGYNMTMGGDGVIGCQPTEQARAKMSTAAKHRASDPVEYERLKQMLAASQKTQKEVLKAHFDNDPEFKARRVKELHEGAVQPESRAKMSAFQKNRWKSKELREELSEKLKKSLATPEARLLKSQAAKASWAIRKAKNHKQE